MPPVLIPFCVRESVHEHERVNGTDAFGYGDGAVQKGGDGVPEVRLYPEKKKSTDDYAYGGGNYGILNIGNPSAGAALVESQIRGGVSADDLIREVGVPELKFSDAAGNPVTCQMTGDPGIKGGVKDALQARIGEIVGFFVHRSVVLNGSNCVFEIVAIRFGRVMEVNLAGSAANKALVIQPVAYNGSDIVTDPEAPPTHRYVTRLQLVR